MIMEIDNFNYIKINGKEYMDLVHDNLYPPLKKLENYLDFIRDLVSKSCKTNKFIKKNEFEHLVYNAFLYFLTNFVKYFILLIRLISFLAFSMSFSSLESLKILCQ